MRAKAEFCAGPAVRVQPAALQKSLLTGRTLREVPRKDVGRERRLPKKQGMFLANIPRIIV